MKTTAFSDLFDIRPTWDHQYKPGDFMPQPARCTLHTRSHPTASLRFTALFWAIVTALDPRTIRQIESSLPESSEFNYHNKSP